MDGLARSPTLTLCIPCWNEADRLPFEAVQNLLTEPDLRLLFVDDGSTDNTREVLQSFRARAGDRVEVLCFSQNSGKAETVRKGLLSAFDRADIVGYADADFSTPSMELLRLARMTKESGADAIIGSRVMTLGVRMERNPVRHYLGRLFATGASLVLKKPIYDTQCGAKFFRTTDVLRAALTHPFRSRWAFDVELLGRVFGGDPGANVVEAPLQEWVEVSGSKIRPFEMVRSGLELLWIARDLARYQRGRGGY